MIVNKTFFMFWVTVDADRKEAAELSLQFDNGLLVYCLSNFICNVHIIFFIGNK